VGELFRSELPPVLLLGRLGTFRADPPLVFPARSALVMEQRCSGEFGRCVASLTGRHPWLIRRRATTAPGDTGALVGMAVLAAAAAAIASPEVYNEKDEAVCASMALVEEAES